MKIFKKIKNKFLEHPNSLGIGYKQHMLCALKTSSLMYLGSIVCLIHSFFPFFFKETATGMCKKILKERENLNKD